MTQLEKIEFTMGIVVWALFYEIFKVWSEVSFGLESQLLLFKRAFRITQMNIATRFIENCALM